MYQRTIKNPFEIFGKTLYKAKPVHMVCLPSGENTGIVFERNGKKIPALIEYVCENEKRLLSSLENGGERVSLVEHVLSAFWGLGVDNVLIQLDNEEPPFCASSEMYVEKILEVGIKEQPALREYIDLKDGEYIESKKRIQIEESDELEINMYVNYPIVGEQKFMFNGSSEDYVEELSKCRTFVAYDLDKNGKAWGKLRRKYRLFPEKPESYMHVVYDKDQYLVPVRYPNEIVRHKMLDFIGDLALVGKRVRGKISAYYTGHKFNQYVAKQIKIVYDKS